MHEATFAGHRKSAEWPIDCDTARALNERDPEKARKWEVSGHHW